MVKKLLMVFLLLMMLPAFALADSVQVIDDANVLSAETERLVTERIERIEAEHQIDLVVLTTVDTPYDGTSEMYYVRDFADDFYDQGGYGMGPDDSGMLILLDMHNRVIWLSTGGVMVDYISDAREEALLDLAYESLVYGDYDAAITGVVEKTGRYMEKGREEGAFRYDEVTGERLSGIYNALTGSEMMLAGIAGAAAAIVLYMSVGSSYSLKGSTYRYDLSANSALQLTKDEEQYLRQTVTRTARHQSSGNSGGRSGGSSGGSGVHTSSGGVSHGGGGRRF